MKIPQYETGWYYVTGHKYINGIIRIGWCDAKSGIYSDTQDSHDIYKDKDLIRISSSDDLICWFLVLRPKDYDIREEIDRLNKELEYELEHSENFYHLISDVFRSSVYSTEKTDKAKVFVIDSMKMDSLLEW